MTAIPVLTAFLDIGFIGTVTANDATVDQAASLHGNEHVDSSRIASTADLSSLTMQQPREVTGSSNIGMNGVGVSDDATDVLANSQLIALGDAITVTANDATVSEAE